MTVKLVNVMAAFKGSDLSAAKREAILNVLQKYDHENLMIYSAYLESLEEDHAEIGLRAVATRQTLRTWLYIAIRTAVV